VSAAHSVTPTRPASRTNPRSRPVSLITDADFLPATTGKGHGGPVARPAAKRIDLDDLLAQLETDTLFTVESASKRGSANFNFDFNLTPLIESSEPGDALADSLFRRPAHTTAMKGKAGVCFNTGGGMSWLDDVQHVISIAQEELETST
jgi:hypothetical protein